MKRLLMVAFHFPPAAMGSGHLRSLGFARYLPENGWEPVVLSACRAAYPNIDMANLALVPQACQVQRAFALDSGRHLAIGGKYPAFLATPDRWHSWWYAAVYQGLRLIRRHRIDAIWSTYPIMTAHSIAATLAKKTKLPWVADFRDPVANSVSSSNAFALPSQKKVERRVLENASRVTFTTPSALRTYSENYPVAASAGRLDVIANGYDEATFAGIPVATRKTGRRPLVLVHSGLLYEDGRSPLAFFEAVARLRRSGDLQPREVRIILRGSSSNASYAHAIEALDLRNLVELAPSISSHEALVEQAGADGLLLFQGARFDRQIPAKVYEYLRIGHPIFALVGVNGDTAALLRHSGGAHMAPIDNVEVIMGRLKEFIHAVFEGSATPADASIVDSYSRQHGAAKLANIMDRVKG